MSLMRSSALKGRAQSLPEFDAYPTYNYLDMNFGYGKGARLLDKSPFHSDGDITTASWVNGLHHRCLDFNSATPDYVEIPATHTQLDFTSEDFSIIARIYLDLLTSWAVIFVRGLYREDGYEFYVHPDYGVQVYTNQDGVSQNTYSRAGDIVTGTWYTIGMSRDGASVKVFKNGVDVTATAATHQNPLTCAESAKIGIHDGLSSYPIDGKIEFLRVFGGIALPAEAHLWFHNMLK